MRRLLAAPFAVAGAMIAFFLIADPAYAQASRTWVSGVGDDANPCSRTAPCKTFAGAISKTRRDGEINCLDPGGFGALTITKSITVDCHEVFASILHAGTNGINIPFDSFAVTDARKTVNLRNINFQGFDTGIVGIRILGGGAGSFVNIEDCLLNGNFSATATGIDDRRTTGALNVVNTTLRDMGGAGITIASAGAGPIKATLSNLRVINAHNGVAVGAGAAVHLSNSLVSSNSTSGIAISGGGINVDATTLPSMGSASTGREERSTCPTTISRSTPPAYPAPSAPIRTTASPTTAQAGQSRPSAA
jgi:hypothetical protein